MTTTVCGDISSRGATLLLSTTIGGTYDEIGPVLTMPDLSATAGTAECTDPYGSNASGYKKEYKTGDFDGGDASFTVKFREGDPIHAVLKSHFDGADKDSECYLRVQLASVNATKFTFPALIKGAGNSFPPDGGIVTFAITAKVNDQVVES